MEDLRAVHINWDTAEAKAADRDHWKFSAARKDVRGSIELEFGLIWAYFNASAHCPVQWQTTGSQESNHRTCGLTTTACSKLVIWRVSPAILQLQDNLSDSPNDPAKMMRGGAMRWSCHSSLLLLFKYHSHCCCALSNMLHCRFT